MSKAFTKESDDDGAFELPDREVSGFPNLVTSEGLALIDAEIGRHSAANADAIAAKDRQAAARAARELRYWTARRNSAQVQPAPSVSDEVMFGSAVNILREDGRRSSYRIVGEDEAEHRAQKNEKRGEEHGAAIAELRMLLVEFRHIAGRIDADQPAHDSDNQHHDQGELVAEDPRGSSRNGGRRLAYFMPFEIRHQKELGQEQAGRQPMFPFDCNPCDINSDQRLHGQHAEADAVRGPVQYERVLAGLPGHQDRSSHDRARGGVHRLAPKDVAGNEQQNDARQQRKSRSSIVPSQLIAMARSRLHPGGAIMTGLAVTAAP